ncbi:cell division protein FtsI [Thermaerobacter sp. PB12/4term]|uniref:cell division protein FtsI n=1 Tax=Thermaerobacter sp. PB12/4term TaxID=2293838 RepID=UPI00193FAB46|nr:cell division protein FtsI [Thermaerobacter sp. PB12/4term]
MPQHERRDEPTRTTPQDGLPGQGHPAGARRQAGPGRTGSPQGTHRPAEAQTNPAADEGLNPLTTAAAGHWGPAWVHAGEGEGVDTPAPYNPLSNSVGFQQFATHPEEFRSAPQSMQNDPPGAGVVTPSVKTPPAPQPPQARPAGEKTGRDAAGRPEPGTPGS